MAYSPYTEEQVEAKLRDVGHRLLHPPSSTDELLILLEEVEKILPFVPQNPHCSQSMKIALYPAYMALIKDKIFKHPDPDVQVAVASCANEITKISAPEYSYNDDIMKEIFRSFMNAFKHLSCGSGIHYERAMRILEYMSKAQSCIMMIDLEMEPVIVEMFHLFLDTIKPNHCSAMFDYMKDIIGSIIKESDDISVELLRPLLSHVKKDRENTSPKSWKLAKSVFKSHAAILRDSVREAVKEMELNINDYADIIASLCQDTPIGRDTVTNEEVATVQVANEEIEEVAAVPVANVEIEEVAAVQVANEEVEGVATVQVANEEIEEVTAVQFVATTASGDGFSKMDEKSQAGAETEIQVQRNKRGSKPNTLMRPEDGYYYYYTELKSAKRGQSKKPESTMNQENPMEGSSKLTKKKAQNKVKGKGSRKQEKTSEGVDAGCSSVEVNHSADLEGNDKQDSQKHKSSYVMEMVMESPKPTNVQRCKVDVKGSKKGKKTTEAVNIPPGSVAAEKGEVSQSAAAPGEREKNKLASQKHESADVLEKVVESSLSKLTTANPSNRKEKGSNRKEKGSKSYKQMKATTGDVFPSSSVGSKKEKASHSGSGLLIMDKKESSSQQCENYDSANVLEKAMDSSLSKPEKAKKSKVDERGSKKAKKRTKGVVHYSTVDAEKDHKHEKYEVSDAVEKVVESPMPELGNAEYPEDLLPEKEPMDLRLEYGQELVNLRIMVWWPLDETYYTGTVESYDPVTKKHRINYDDGDEEILDMSEERWEPFSERQPHQSSREKEADPSPAKEHGNRNQMKSRKRKTVSSKKKHAVASSERSKSEGCNINSGHAALQSIPVNFESDDESHEANFSWKAKAMSRAGLKGPKTG